MRCLFAATVSLICAMFVFVADAAEVRNGRIAFTGHDFNTDSDELYSMLPDGSGRINLTRHFGADARPPVYSPDGRWVAFGCTTPGDDHRPFPTDVCVVKDGGERPKPVRLTSIRGIERPTAFSPDSKWVLFTAQGDNGRSGVYLIRRNGRDLTKLTDPHAIPYPEGPTFSPDGKRILFASVLGKGGGGIYLMDRDGSNLTLVIDQTPRPSDFNLAVEAHFSPDGSQILFFAFLADEDDRDLFLSDLQGGNVVRLSSDEAELETTAGFSPDGELIAYAFGGQIWTVRPDGTDNHVAIDGGAFRVGPAAWAPSGHRLVFQMTKAGTSEIGTATPDGSPEPVTDTDRIKEQSPAWARKP